MTRNCTRGEGDLYGDLGLVAVEQLARGLSLRLDRQLHRPGRGDARARDWTRRRPRFTPFPANVSVPGPGTVTGKLAVPFLVFRVAFPIVNALEVGWRISRNCPISPLSVTPQGLTPSGSK